MYNEGVETISDMYNEGVGKKTQKIE